MLFIIVMDVLSSLFKHAEERGLLHDLAIRNVKFRLSIYADDVVLFVKPAVELFRTVVTFCSAIQLLFHATIWGCLFLIRSWGGGTSCSGWTR
jgi:hypothetical protein